MSIVLQKVEDSDVASVVSVAGHIPPALVQYDVHPTEQMLSDAEWTVLSLASSELLNALIQSRRTAYVKFQVSHLFLVLIHDLFGSVLNSSFNFKFNVT